MQWKFKHEATNGLLHCFIGKKKKFWTKQIASVATMTGDLPCLQLAPPQLHSVAAPLGYVWPPCKGNPLVKLAVSKTCTDSPAWVASSGFYGFASGTGVFLATWEMLSKLAIANDGLLRAPCNLRNKTPPSLNFWKEPHLEK